MTIEIETFKLTEPIPVAMKRTNRSMSLHTFIKGPIPIDWLEQAAKMSGSCFRLAVCLWWLRGYKPGGFCKLTRNRLSRFNLRSRTTVSDALHKLEQAGLISVQRKHWRSPLVSIFVTEEIANNS